jgi:hypothetical protein
MLSFRFTIGNAFRNYSTHPITVPKNQIDYRKLVNAGLDSGNFTIVFPRGEKVRGHMYFGRAGFGQYYQLRIYTEESIPEYLKKDDNVLVILVKDVLSKYAIIEYQN